MKSAGYLARGSDHPSGHWLVGWPVCYPSGALAKRLRIRHHVNPLKLSYSEREVAPVSLAGPDPEVEVGCADARWLFERARAEPEGRFVGLEIREELVAWVAARLARAGLADRVEVRFCNANTDLERLFEPRRVRRFVVNFPDPWFKRWQHKRRLLTPELARSMASRLAPGGQVFFQSDVFELSLDAMAVLEDADDVLRNVHGPWTFARANPFGARSKREAQSQRKGRPIWRLLYERTP